MTLITTDTMSGYEVEIHAHATGQWTILEPGEGYDFQRLIGSGQTLESAKSAARRELAKRKVKVEVPFRMRGRKSGIATGIHAGTRKVTARVRVGGGSWANTQISRSYGDPTVFKPDTPDAVFDQIGGLEHKKRELDKTIEALSKEWSLDLHHAVTDAIEKAAAERLGAETD